MSTAFTLSTSCDHPAASTTPQGNQIVRLRYGLVTDDEVSANAASGQPVLG